MTRAGRVVSLLTETLAALCPEARTRKTLGRLVTGGLEAERTWTISVGKAASKMASAAASLGFERGLLISPNPEAGPLSYAPHRAGHPLPNAASFAAGERALSLAQSLGPGDNLLCLLSGGASAMMCSPGEGLSRASRG